MRTMRAKTKMKKETPDMIHILQQFNPLSIYPSLLSFKFSFSSVIVIVCIYAYSYTFLNTAYSVYVMLPGYMVSELTLWHWKKQVSVLFAGKATSLNPRFPRLLLLTVLCVELRFYGLSPSSQACPLGLSLFSSHLCSPIGEFLWIQFLIFLRNTKSQKTLWSSRSYHLSTLSLAIFSEPS